MKTTHSRLLYPGLLALLLCSACTTPKGPDALNAPARARLSQAAISEWQNQKFSMFIHFGLYSLPAGVWKNEKISNGYSEQIRGHGKIPKEEYRALARSFNPAQWNPDSIVTLAKQAGMKSIVITSKHHDGFSMFHTAFSDFNIVDATPFKRDVIKELSNACRKQGMKFGVYFSLIDWDFPGALPISGHNSDGIPPLHHQFNLNQVRELMTRYGTISEIWFDMGKPTFQQSKELADLVRKFQPNCLISGRLWNDQGDFAVTGDNAAPDFKMGTLWQSPSSMFDETWGYRSWQERGEAKTKALEKLTSLIKVTGNGGNYLLNIGPMGTGEIVPFEREVLTLIGNWFARNGEAITGTTPSPLPEQAWGVITAKPGKLFLLVLRVPQDGKLLLKGLKSNCKQAYLLSDRSNKLATTPTAEGCLVNLGTPSPATDLVKVIAFEYSGILDYIPAGALSPATDGSYTLNYANATKYHSYSGIEYYSTKPTVIKLEWQCLAAGESTYDLTLCYTRKDMEKKLQLTVNKKPCEVLLEEQAASPQGDMIKRIKGIKLKGNSLNTIQIQLADQSNPHKDLELSGLTLKLSKPE
ncbi:MAG: alpha-L-fucosidase [bacterium]